jgi:transposase
VTAQTVWKWRRRFVERGLDGLLDEPRPGVPRKIDDAKVESVIVQTLESQPPGATHWSTRSMARYCGISTSSVGRIWRAFGLQPHRLESFKLSTDPRFVAKVRDIVGLYLNPPDHALCCASMRSHRSRRSIAASRCCQCGRGKPSGDEVAAGRDLKISDVTGVLVDHRHQRRPGVAQHISLCILVGRAVSFRLFT